MSSGNGQRDDETVTRTRRRAFTASLVGTSLEWYDYFIFASAAALVFNKLFFPSFDPLTGTLLSLATFTAGFVVRPLGAMVFGHFGDRVGRKQALTISLLIVGASTFLIGVLPTYATVGVLAPILLVLLRMAQGFALGGEWGGAVLISMEHGPQSGAASTRPGRSSACRSATCCRRASSRCSCSCSPRTSCWRGAGASRSCSAACCSASGSTPGWRSRSRPRS